METLFMANPYSDRNTATGTVREASDRFSRDSKEFAQHARTQAENVMQDASQAASAFYDQASGWVQENYGKTIAVVTVLAAVGIVGFMLGKNRNSLDLPNL